MQKPSQSDIEKSVAGNKNRDKLFAVLGLLATFVGMLTLAALLADLAMDGLARLKPHFFTSFPSRFPGQAGILSSWVGTILVMFVTALTAVPMGVAAGVYLEEYSPKNWFTALIEINIANLAGVPSIVYGLMALGLFVYQFRFGQSVLSAGLTLALLILPIVIVSTRESIRAVPGTHERSGLCPRRDKMANHQRSRLALLHGRHFNRRDHRSFSGHRRNRAVDYDRRPYFYRISAGLSDQRGISFHLF